MKRPFPPAKRPDRLNDADAIRLVRMIAADSNNIVIIEHATKRRKQRSITRQQIERCVQMGTITEGPFINARGNWQMNLTRHAAGRDHLQRRNRVGDAGYRDHSILRSNR